MPVATRGEVRRSHLLNRRA